MRRTPRPTEWKAPKTPKPTNPPKIKTPKPTKTPRPTEWKTPKPTNPPKTPKPTVWKTPRPTNPPKIKLTMHSYERSLYLQSFFCNATYQNAQTNSMESTKDTKTDESS